MSLNIDNKFISIKRSDPKIEDFLLGKLHLGLRPIPVDCLFINTPDEKITFQLLPIHELNIPKKINIFFKSIRPSFLSLTLGPCLITLVLENNNLIAHSKLLGVTAFFSLLFFHFAAFLWNDYQDYIFGSDKYSKAAQNNVLRKGWISAEQLKSWSFRFGILGILLGLPSLYFHNGPLLWVSAVSLVMTYFYSRPKSGLKSYGVSTFAVFVIMGPLISLGYSMGVFGHISMKLLFASTLLGMSAALVIQMRNLRSILNDTQAKIGTFVSRLGFDRSRKLLVLHSLSCLTAWTMYSFYFSNNLYITLLFTSPVTFYTAILTNKILNVKSPVSSNLQTLWKWGLVLNYILIISIIGFEFTLV